ncbi:amino acid transporter [Saccharata proteae CBS 121410]|uniref:Amino acid transporter n=1 Tax=Saccharata proteae CBS 121410 TaxID=1314787 RepID=A0A9P4I0N2_9PEZI|nr:amino acid transporter [Saccharata proteae CBS 121410]
MDLEAGRYSGQASRDEKPDYKVNDVDIKPPYTIENGPVVGEVVNASGHVQELERNFSVLSACAVGICVGNTWAAIGGSIVVAIYNGGPPGVLYELIADSFFYWLVAACVAELASAIPSSAGVYHWASITGGPKYGRIIGWFAGWWNLFAWIFGAASMTSILANLTLGMWGLMHPSFVPQQWHTFVVYIIVTLSCCSVVLFWNSGLPRLNEFGLFFTLAGVFVTILVCAIMPSTTGEGYASDDFVWKDWQNQTGYTSDGFVFLAGMLNAAFAVGTPDCIAHLAEEIPQPRINVPKAIAAQMVVGFITAFCYLISIFYGLSDMDALLNNTYTTPLAEVYHQATSSRAGACGLLVLVFMPCVGACIGTYITSGRMLWTLARDGATPFSDTLGRISPTHKNPFNATLVCGIFVTVLGCIYVGSSTAFNAFVGSFVVLSSSSYLAAILPHLLSRRQYVEPGPFYMKGALGTVILSVACAYIAVFVVIFCFPTSMPVSAENMNYACVITGGLTVIVGAWWLWKDKRGYVGPRTVVEEERSGSVVGEKTSMG